MLPNISIEGSWRNSLKANVVKHIFSNTRIDLYFSSHANMGAQY